MEYLRMTCKRGIPTGQKEGFLTGISFMRFEGVFQYLHPKLFILNFRNMTETKQIYKCPVCGNIVEVVHAGEGQLVCCGKPMELLSANTVDASLEKHVPVIKKTEFGYNIKIGTEPHPMTPEHHIEWIELIAGDKVYRKELKPGNQPQAEFLLAEGGQVEARAYCNLHGLWSAKM